MNSYALFDEIEARARGTCLLYLYWQLLVRMSSTINIYSTVAILQWFYRGPVLCYTNCSFKQLLRSRWVIRKRQYRMLHRGTCTCTGTVPCTCYCTPNITYYCIVQYCTWRMCGKWEVGTCLPSSGATPTSHLPLPLPLNLLSSTVQVPVLILVQVPVLNTWKRKRTRSTCTTEYWCTCM